MNRSTDPRFQAGRGRGFPSATGRGPPSRGPPLMGRGSGPPPGGMPPSRGGFGGRGPAMMGPGRFQGRGPFPGGPPLGGRGPPPSMGRGPGRGPLPLPPPHSGHHHPNGRGLAPPPPPPPMRPPQQPHPQHLPPQLHRGPPMMGVGVQGMRGPLPGRGPPPMVHNPMARSPSQFNPHMNGRLPQRPPPPPPPPRAMQQMLPKTSAMGHAMPPGAMNVARPGMLYSAAPSPAIPPIVTGMATAQHLASTAAATPQPAVVAPYAQVQADQAWSEHTAPNGIKYYFNSLTQKSTYTKPDVLTEKTTVAVSSVAAAPAEPRKWREYTDASTGKKYYSDGTTTTWVKPDDFDGIESAVEEKETSEPPRKKRKAKKETEFGSKEEAVAGFKGLLLAKDISPTQKWNEVIKICSPDSRWEACEDVLTVGERKQALAEYRTKRANDLRSIDRQEKARAREAFTQLLTEVLPTVNAFSGWNAQFVDVRDVLAQDDRFHTVADDAMRESLFLDFCEEYRKRDERKKRSRKRDAQDAFLAFLKEKEENGQLTFASTWASFVACLSDTELADPSFATSAVMLDTDRQVYFADFVIELQTTEDDKRRRIRGARRRAEKAQREAFIDALRDFGKSGVISPSSRWRDSEDLVAADPRYGPIREQGRDIPGDLFEDFVDEWRDTYRRDRPVLNKLARSKTNGEIVVTADTTYDQFVKALLDAAANTPGGYDEARHVINKSSRVSSVQTFLNELVNGDKNTPVTRRVSALRSRNYESSEDEGEIVEDGEVANNTSENGLQPIETNIENDVPVADSDDPASHNGVAAVKKVAK